MSGPSPITKRKSARAGKRLKYTSSINDETLSEDTDPTFEIAYVDIGGVDSVKGITEKETLLFQNAPSRARRIVRDGDVIISTVRTYLRAIAAIQNPQPGLIVSTGFAVVRPRETLLSRFAAYGLHAPYFVERVVAESAGVSYPAINESLLACFPLTLPTLPEQHAISNFLDRETAKTDALVVKKERLIELLQEKRAALITQAVTKGLDPSVPIKASGVEWLGQIPAHWEVKRLKYLAKEPLKYGASEVAEFDDPQFPRFIRITDIDESGGLHEETFRSLPEEIARSYLLQRGDLLFARSGATVGKTFLYRESWGRACYAGYLIRLRTDETMSIPEFIAYFAMSSAYWSWLSGTFIQATIQNVSAERYASLSVCLPPLVEQRAIVQHLDHETAKLDAFIAKVREGIERLKEYRTALISAAVTGKIDVRGTLADSGQVKATSVSTAK